MIASYKHNFIFIKPKKVGGTTAEVVLSAICGPDDIITPLGSHDEITRSSAGELLPRNFCTAEDEKIWRDAMRLQDFDVIKQMSRKEYTFHAHMPAIEIRKALDSKFWKQACKITAVRHPYEKAVSKAFFHYREKKHGPFEAHLDRVVRAGKYTSFQCYTINGRSVIDEFLHQETLHADLQRVGEKLGFPIPQVLPRFKSDSRTDKRPAREILSEEQKNIVFNFCQPEFEEMSYER